MKTPDRLVEFNQLAPDFELRDLDGEVHYPGAYRGRIVVLNFWSCECPHSERTDRSMTAMSARWPEEVAILWIASNRNESEQALQEAAHTRRIRTILLDADCAVANLYAAQTTPHVFVIDRAGSLRYRGAVDDATFRRRVPTRFFLEEALKSLLEGLSPALRESPAYGCTIVREV